MMFLTDLLANVTLGNLELSRSSYTLWPRSFKTLSTRSFLASAVVFDFCLLMFLVHNFLTINLDCHFLAGDGCLLSLGRLGLPFFRDELLILWQALLPCEVCREARYQREVLSVDVHLPLDGLHAALLREVDAQPSQRLPDGVPYLGLYLGPVRDVFRPDCLVGDLCGANVGYDRDRCFVGNVIPPPIDLLVEDLERDVAALVVEERDAVGEPQKLPPGFENLPSVGQPDLDEEGKPRI